MTLLARHLPDVPRGRLFSTCSTRDIHRVRRRGTQVAVPAGTVIHPQHGRPNWVYIVLSGSAVGDDRGSMRTLTVGDVHGARPMLAGDDTCGALEALTDVRLLVLGRSEFTALLSDTPGFAHGVARQLA
jgi:CRP-like cAMP-binding protein